MSEYHSRVSSLDGIRGLAILFVLVGHSLDKWAPAFAETLPGRILGNSSFGVQLFFVLSGYLISKGLYKELDVTSGLDLRAFWVRRIKRIFPVFYAYIVLIFILSFLGSIEIGDYAHVAAATFLWNYAVYIFDLSLFNDGTWYYGHFWSLALEQQFYLIFPVVLFLLRRERLVCGLIFLVLIVPIIRVLSYFAFPDSRGQIGMMFHTACDGVVVGCLTSYLVSYRKKIELDMASGRVFFVLLVVVMLVNVFLGSVLAGAYDLPVGKSVNNFMAASVIYCSVQYRFFESFLNSRVLVFFGLISYSLYVAQQVFLHPGYVSGYFDLDWYLVIPMLVLCSAISYRFIEKPFLSKR